jgi:hypothetical protein
MPRLQAWPNPRAPDKTGTVPLGETKWGPAETVLRTCLTRRERQEPDRWTTSEAKALLGAALLGQKQYAKAEPLLLEGYQGMKQREALIPVPSRVRLTETLGRLAQLCDACGNKAQADQWRKTQRETKAEAGHSQGKP